MSASERRVAPRQKSFLRGRLFFNNRLNVVDCVIRDISDTGARLVYSEAVTTPDEVELHIPQKDQTLYAKIAWRRGEEVGVTFKAATQKDGSLGADEILERFARLEAEIAGIKRIIKKLKVDLLPDIDVA